ncbi:DUF2249 domain-containing protein [Afipia birgiae]|uniref:DUF2249 domain-containing protein n=1 Tax=Afipia birgiae TaxID=151414 RepID=UPI002AA5CC13
MLNLTDLQIGEAKELAMSEDVHASERVINVRDIDPRHRHRIIFQLFEQLGSDSSLQLVVDHDPRPLRLQLEAKHGARCRWTYLVQGPDVWRIRLQQG